VAESHLGLLLLACLIDRTFFFAEGGNEVESKI